MMATLEGEQKEKVQKRLAEEHIIWLTTVRKDGTPQPTPVWFLWENGTFLIYSQPNVQKIRNINQNPMVALTLNCDEWGGEVVIITGKAVIDEAAPPVHQNQNYVDKYRQGIKDIGMDPESMASSYNVSIRITPDHVRAW